ncbi:MAG: hypothetical protein H6625_06875 [Bdellovibrionaceae bacterium]|nr:hypothetical protein [Pseudobdellovibrionaceae bacterium]
MNSKPDHLPMTPDLQVEDIIAEIDGSKVKIWSLNRVRETTDDGKTIDGYLMQVANSTPMAHQKLCITLRSKHSNENGMGCTFFNGKHGGVK